MHLGRDSRPNEILARSVNIYLGRDSRPSEILARSVKLHAGRGSHPGDICVTQACEGCSLEANDSITQKHRISQESAGHRHYSEASMEPQNESEASAASGTLPELCGIYPLSRNRPRHPGHRHYFRGTDQTGNPQSTRPEGAAVLRQLSLIRSHLLRDSTF